VIPTAGTGPAIPSARLGRYRALGERRSADYRVPLSSAIYRHIDHAPQVDELSVIGVVFSGTVVRGDARPTPALRRHR
jgi:hypothetical protein